VSLTAVTCPVCGTGGHFSLAPPGLCAPCEAAIRADERAKVEARIHAWLLHVHAHLAPRDAARASEWEDAADGVLAGTHWRGDK